MIIWNDEGIVISSRNLREEFRIVDVFTKNHGRVAGLIKLTNLKKMNIISNVNVDLQAKSNDNLGFWKLRNEKQNWIFAMKNPKIMMICQSICFILNKILPHNIKNLKLFLTIDTFFSSLNTISEEVSILFYSYFEFITLQTMGYAIDINNPHNKIDIPACWHIFNNINKIDNLFDTQYEKDDIKKSLNLTWKLINEHMIISDNYFRNNII